MAIQIRLHPLYSRTAVTAGDIERHSPPSVCGRNPEVIDDDAAVMCLDVLPCAPAVVVLISALPQPSTWNTSNSFLQNTRRLTGLLLLYNPPSIFLFPPPSHHFPHHVQPPACCSQPCPAHGGNHKGRRQVSQARGCQLYIRNRWI